MPRKSADNPYAIPPSSNPYATTGNPYAAAPDVTGLDVPTGEGEYWMTNQHGGRLHVPYSKVRQAAQAGYEMKPEDRDRFMTDSRADKKLNRMFPDLKLPEGVRITGMNPAGQPMFGIRGTAPKGSAARRFLSSAGEMIAAPVTGTYHALSDAPKTPEETALASGPHGTLALASKRMLVDPSLEQYHKMIEEGKQANAATNPEARKLHQVLTFEHALGTVPVIGPAFVGTGEKIGGQWATGDVAGGLGTVAGFGATEVAPKLASDVVRSKFITERMPRHAITRIIRPMKRDVEFGKDPVGAILDEGIIAKGIDPAEGLESMGKQVAVKLDAVGKRIDKVVQDPKYANTKVNVAGFLNPINDAMADAAKSGDVTLFERLAEVKQEPTSEYSAKPFVTASGKVTTRRIGSRRLLLSPKEVLQFKRQIGSRIRWTQNALDEPVNEALGASYGRIKDSLDRAVPELKPLNNSYANLVSAAKAVERRLPIEARQAYVSLTDVVLGGALGSMAPHYLPLLLAKKVAQHPYVRTLGARTGYRLRNLPDVAMTTTVPAVAALQSQQNRQRPKTLRELQAEARRRKPAASQYDVMIGTTAPQ
jgi:hypothetical protein